LKTKRPAAQSDQQRALLARSPGGCPEALLVHGHGVSIDAFVELIEAGLAKVRVERVSRPAMEVTQVKITDAGRLAIA
jgi:hypothetical protein